MGQKVHPVGFRVGISRSWDSLWYSEKENYTKCLHEDIKIRKFLKTTQKEAGISRIVIERNSGTIKVYVHSAKPGILLGQRNRKLKKVREDLSRFTGDEVQLFIMEVRKAEIEAQLVAESIAQQLEKRVSFRRAMKKSLKSAMGAGAKGIKIACSGRLGGAEMSRCEWYREGRVPLHTLRADIDYGFATALTTYGIIGVKIWIYKGEAGSESE
ncbi:MAG: 30S ribosomal protein S3 [Myxococcota bacterium]|nr:30S ribosomal protein S3 [Myxococcota bacterium]